MKLSFYYSCPDWHHEYGYNPLSTHQWKSVNMEGSLENVQADEFDYEVMVHKCVVNKKDNKSYFNFYEGIYSSAVSLKKYHGLPKKVRLLNTGAELPFAIEYLPGFGDGEVGKLDPEYLHITNIPIDDLENEPIVIEITW